jgi:nitrogen fixation protein NifU and related proteins
MFSERLLGHFTNPRNVGELSEPSVAVEVSNPACGDLMRLSVRFDNGIVSEVRYRTRGCTAAIAAGSALSEWMQGKTRAELRALTPKMVEEALGGLPPESRHAAVLCVDAVRAVLRQVG